LSADSRRAKKHIAACPAGEDRQNDGEKEKRRIIEISGV